MITLFETFEKNPTPEVLYYRNTDWLVEPCKKLLQDLNITIHPRHRCNTYNFCSNAFPTVRYEMFRKMESMPEYLHVNCGLTSSTPINYLIKYMSCHPPYFIVGENMAKVFEEIYETEFRRLEVVAVFENEPQETFDWIAVKAPQARIVTIEVKLKRTGELICGLK